MNTQLNTNIWYYKPAFYAHMLSSVCMLIAVILFIKNYKSIMRLDVAHIIQILAVLAIAIGSHAQNHMSLERDYGYDPIALLS
jgi:hypothetical protein